MRLRAGDPALLDADLELAEKVISSDAAVDAQYRDAEDRAFDLLARQAPVAGDLRRIVASLRMVSDLERGGDLSVHIAEVARRRYPSSAIPAALRSTILEMGQIGERIMTKAGSIIATSDLVLAEQIEQDDDVVDRLHRQLFHVLLEDEWEGSVEAAVDITLCSRFYERIADHAVAWPGAWSTWSPGLARRRRRSSANARAALKGGAHSAHRFQQQRPSCGHFSRAKPAPSTVRIRGPGESATRPRSRKPARGLAPGPGPRQSNHWR